jgi:Oxidoreductase molybdopterin binding domain
MKPASVDRVLAVLILALIATGLVSLRFGAPSGAWLFIVHGILAGSLAVAVIVKLRVSLRHAVLQRRLARLVLALALSLVVVGALVFGYAWAASGEMLEIGSWTVLTLHAWLGLAAVPLVIVHLLPRRWRLLRPGRGSSVVRGIDRRSLLVGGALAAAGLGLFGVAQVLERIRGGERRFTGSRWLDAGGVPPATTFLGDTPPAELGAGRLSVSGRVTHPLDLDLDALHRLGYVETTAVLDCTSGWAIETAWAGTPLAALLDAAGVEPGARRVTVRSATGWSANIPLPVSPGCLLATDVAGQPLPLANGAPVRLVMPDRRGLDWVKWVTAVVIE